MFNSGFLRSVLLVCLIFTAAVLTFADTIRLKDGSIIKGKIVGFTGGKFTVVIGDDSRQRRMTFTADEVESIVFDSDSMPTAKANNSETADKNTNTASDTTIITVGQNNKTADSPPAPVKPDSTDSSAVRTDKTTAGSTVNSNAPTAAPTIRVKVLADNTSNGWTNSGFVVQKGQRIKITGTGRVDLGGGRYTTPIGAASIVDEKKLIKDSPTGALIAVIGDDNNEFIFIGESREFVATRDGALFLGVNEGNLDDNLGSFDAKIEIFPGQ